MQRSGQNHLGNCEHCPLRFTAQCRRLSVCLRCQELGNGQQKKVSMQRSFTTGQDSMLEGQHGLESAQAGREMSRGEFACLGIVGDFTTVPAIRLMRNMSLLSQSTGSSKISCLLTLQLQGRLLSQAARWCAVCRANFRATYSWQC